jgi:hypothetical protein
MHLGTQIVNKVWAPLLETWVIMDDTSNNTSLNCTTATVLNNFRRSCYIATEDLVPTKEARPERIHFRLQDATEVELAKINFDVEIKAFIELIIGSTNPFIQNHFR